MQITFLGTSTGVPMAGRRCSCTMVEVDGRYYIIDLGMLVIEEFRTRGLPVENIRGVFLTHMHSDHMGGLYPFIDMLGWYFKEADPVICLPDMEIVKLFDIWYAATGTSRRPLQYRQTQPGVIFDDGTVKVTAFPTQHCPNAYSLLVEGAGKRVFFTGDMKHPAIDFPAAVKQQEIDLAICEAAHFAATDYAPVLAESKIRRVCVNHYSAWNMANIQTLSQDSPQLNVTVVTDGMEIRI